jgi:hypothetical protein
MKNLYFAVVFIMAMGLNKLSFGCDGEQQIRIINGLASVKLSITQVVIGEFGATAEAQTVNGKKLIELQQQRINILDQSMRAAVHANWQKSKMLETKYQAIGKQITPLEDSLEFFLQRK